MPGRSPLSPLYLAATLALLVVAAAPRADLASPSASEEEMAATMPAIAGSLPLSLSSFSAHGRLEGHIHGQLSFPFARVRAALRDPAAWCAIIALHQNVKACVLIERAGAEVLRVYNGKKYFQDTSSAIVSEYVFNRDLSDPASLTVSLTAPLGAFGTSDHRIVLDARADPRGGTAIEFSYHYQASRLAQTSLRIYLATSGANKIGFSVVGENADGQAQHVTGMRGLIERNAVRYYLAMLTYLESRDVPAAAADEWRARRWYDLTQTYAAQLHEMERGEYLANKRREFAQQADLQAQADRHPESERGN